MEWCFFVESIGSRCYHPCILPMLPYVHDLDLINDESDDDQHYDYLNLILYHVTSTAVPSRRLLLVFNLKTREHKFDKQ